MDTKRFNIIKRNTVLIIIVLIAMLACGIVLFNIAEVRIVKIVISLVFEFCISGIMWLVILHSYAPISCTDEEEKTMKFSDRMLALCIIVNLLALIPALPSIIMIYITWGILCISIIRFVSFIFMKIKNISLIVLNKK